MSKTPLNPSALKEYPQGSVAYQFNEQFTNEHIAAYKADLLKAAEKLGLELTEESLPVIAREMRKTKKDDEQIRRMLHSQERVSEMAWETIQKKQAEMLKRKEEKEKESDESDKK